MASQPSALLQHIGNTIIANFYRAIALTISQGAIILLFSIGTASLLQRGLRSRSTQAMLSLAIISFIIATVNWAAGTAFTIRQVQEPMVKNLEMPLDERLQVTNYETSSIHLVAIWATELMPIIPDSIVIWRTWVIFFENRLAMIGPLLLLLGTIATILAFLSLSLNFETLIESSQGANNLQNNMFLASLVFSLATNTLATVMVGYKLWAHRTLLARMLGAQQRFTSAQNVLVIIVESGMLYFALQLTNIILDSLPEAPRDSAASIAATVFYNIFIHLSAMYPLIVILLVNNQRSFVDTFGFTSIDLNGVQTHGQNASAHPMTPGQSAVPNMESLEHPNITKEDNVDVEQSVQGVENENVDVAVEKRQASTAPF